MLNQNRYLTPEGLKAAAQKLVTGIAEIRTLAKVESSGQGFLEDGRCIIRFEPHIFHAQTKGKFAGSHPHLSYPKWLPGYPRSVNHSWILFREACTLDARAAVLSTSWGMFQIMGFNYTSCGCQTASEFVAKMESSVDDQLILTVQFLLTTGMAVYLREHQWAEFARRYNGLQYKINRYDEHLAYWFGIFSR